MKKHNRHHSSAAPLALTLLGLLGATAASAEGEAQADSSCQREVRRVAVWPHSSPKAPQFARFEDREVTICDGKVVSQQKRPETSRAQG